VIPRYLQAVGQVHVALPEAEPSQVVAAGAIRCVRLWVEAEDGRPIGRARSGERIVVVAVYEVAEEADEPVLGFALKSEDGTVVYSLNTDWQGTRTERMRAGQCIETRAHLIAALRNGRYDIGFGVANHDLSVMFDQVERAAAIVIHGSCVRHGLTDLQGWVDYRIVDDTAAAAATTAHGRPGRGSRR
jgi:hypothetical protein